MLPIAAPATDLREPPTLTLGKKQSYYRTLSPVVRLPAVLRGAAASLWSYGLMDMRTPLGMVQPNPVPYGPAVREERARRDQAAYHCPRA